MPLFISVKCFVMFKLMGWKSDWFLTWSMFVILISQFYKKVEFSIHTKQENLNHNIQIAVENMPFLVGKFNIVK